MFGYKKKLDSIGVIGGKDAEKFIKNMELAKLSKIPEAERMGMESNYRSILLKANFNN